MTGPRGRRRVVLSQCQAVMTRLGFRTRGIRCLFGKQSPSIMTLTCPDVHNVIVAAPLDLGILSCSREGHPQNLQLCVVSVMAER